MIKTDEEIAGTTALGMTRRQFIGKACLAIPAIAILGIGLSGCGEGDIFGDDDYDDYGERRRRRGNRDSDRDRDGRDEERREGEDRERREDGERRY